MQLIDNWPEIRAAVFGYAVPAALPDATKAHLAAARIAGSPVDMAVKTLEALYAARADLDDAGRTLCGQLADFCASQGFHGLDQDNRGLNIKRAMRRDLGELAGSGADPAPLAQYAPGGEA